MAGFFILIAFNLLGWCVHACGVPLPENVLGMLLLLAALSLGWVKVEWVEESAGVLLRHMMLFFAPVIVGVLPLLPELQRSVVPAAGGMVVSTVMTLLATAGVAEMLGRRR